MEKKSKINVWQLTALTAINMIGSGIIMLPAQLAKVGTMSVLSWVVTVLGASMLAYGFARCGMFSKREGGMGGYAHYAYGKTGDFMANYSYGISLVIANTAVAVSVVGYGKVFLGIELSPLITTICVVAFIWLAAASNFGGAKITGKIGSFTIWGIVGPIFVLCIIGWFWFNPSLYVESWNPNNLPLFSGIEQSISITLWAFLGLESAAANMDVVENPQKDVPIACIGGTIGAAIIYIISTNVVAGIIPNAELLNSTAPFGMVFAQIFNPVVGKIVMGSMFIACFGSLLAWQFTIAQVFKSSSKEGYFPKIFSSVNKTDAPIKGMIIICSIQTGFAFMTISPNLNNQFKEIVNLAVVTNIVPYILSMGALRIIQLKEEVCDRYVKISNIIAFMAIIYSIYAVFAAGLKAVCYGGFIIAIGVAFFLVVEKKLKKNKIESEIL